MLKSAIALSLSVASIGAAQAKDLTVNMMDLETHSSAGTVTIKESDYGLVFSPSLEGLSSGGHGFHVHENPSCDTAMKNGKEVPGGAAGSHMDPENTGSHGTPWSDNAHLGDLPLLYVGEEGMAKHPVLAPRLTMDDVKGRALMVHEGGDNYSDQPKKLGGGGPRALCGVISKS